MATSNNYTTTTVQAGADYSGSGKQYHALALADGQLAANGEEASGILINKPDNGEFATVAYNGEIKFAAGAAVSKGDKLTVANSGWFTTADSNDTVVGEAKAAVTSGSIGTGLFAFPNATGKASSVIMSLTPLDDIEAGCAVSMADGLVADTFEQASYVAPSDMSSGTAYNCVVFGQANVRMIPSECSSAGDGLKVVTSGYFSIADSGYHVIARALTNIGSDSTGSAIFYGGPAGYQGA